MSETPGSESQVDWLSDYLWARGFSLLHPKPYVAATGTELVERHTSADERFHYPQLWLTCKLSTQRSCGTTFGKSVQL